MKINTNTSSMFVTKQLGDAYKSYFRFYQQAVNREENKQVGG